MVAVISAIVVGTMDHPASEEYVDKKEGMLGYLVRQRMFHFLIYIGVQTSPYRCQSQFCLTRGSTYGLR